MKKKILGFLICTLLITTTVLPVAVNIKIGFAIEKQVLLSSLKSFEMPFLNGQFLKENWNEKNEKPLDRGSDVILCVKQTTDGGYIATGYTSTYSSWNSDCWLIKTDSNGNEQWNVSYDIYGGSYGCSVQQTTDGGYIIVGWGYSSAGTVIYLIKTDSMGSMDWNKQFGLQSYDAFAFSVQQTSDGGYAMTGFTTSFVAGNGDCWLIKTDSNGNEQWNKTFGGNNYDYGFYGQQIDGGYIITGRTESYGLLGDCWLIKTDSNGNELWNKTFGGTSSDQGNSVQKITDGYIIIGSTSSYGDDMNDVWLIKTDSNGNEQWNKTWSGANTEVGLSLLKKFSGGISVQQTDSGYIITGITDENENNDALLIKTDANGNEQWKKIFGGSQLDESYCVKMTSDDGYIIGGATCSFGTSDNDGWLIKTDSSGNEQWNKTFPANPPPKTPSNPEPEDGETDVNIDVDLSWSGGDPDGDDVTYDVYFGTESPPPKLVSNQSGKTYDPGVLDFNTEYYWQIVAWDSEGASASGPIWSFTTEKNLPPNTPSDPDPPDGATDVSIEDILRWTGGDPNSGDMVTYDVYFGKSSTPPLVFKDLSETVYDQGTMDLATTYYWQIVAEDNLGLTSNGPIWHFTTELEPNSPPTAPDIFGESRGSPGVELCWAFESDDPDDNQVKYIIEWGDGTVNETDYHQDSTLVEACYTYEEEGEYIIKAKAEDEKGLISKESTYPVTITISRSRTIYHPLLLRLFERFPNLFPMLERLLSLIRVI